MVAIFSSYDAAKNFRVPASENVPGNATWAKEQHAAYFFDAAKHEDYLVVTPFGFSTPQQYSTRIDLTGSAPSACTLALKGRCVLAADEVEYPTDALSARGYGKVVLSGTITRDGWIKDVRMVSIESGSNTSQEMVAKAAIQNLKSWKMDAAPREDLFRIMYSYQIEASPVAGSTHVQFDLPDKIMIVGTPPVTR
jgi:TonB family protein